MSNQTRIVHVQLFQRGAVKSNAWCLVTVSAVWYAAILFWPQVLWWGLFGCFAPIMYAALRWPHRVGFCLGIWWALVFCAVHWIGFVSIFFERSDVWWAPLCWVLMICYATLYAGLWFSAATTAQRLLGRWIHGGEEAYFLAWTVCTWLYLEWVYRGLCWIFGSWVGYPFSYPLVVLAQQPWTLQLLRWMPASLLTASLVVVNGAAAMLAVTQSRRWFFVLLSALAPFLAGALIPRCAEQDALANEVCACCVYCPPPQATGKGACAVMWEIADALERCRGCNPRACYVMMPESSYPFVLEQEAIDEWGRVLGDERTLFIGAQRVEVDEKGYKKYFNSIFALRAGRIIHSYDKRQTLFFTEQIPESFKKRAPWTANLFLHDKKPFSNGTSDTQGWRPAPATINRYLITPFICSELFLDPTPPKQKSLAYCASNDHWFANPYLRDLMQLTCTLRSIEWQVPIIHICHSDARFLTSHGTCSLLAS